MTTEQIIEANRTAANAEGLFTSPRATEAFRQNLEYVERENATPHMIAVRLTDLQMQLARLAGKIAELT